MKKIRDGQPVPDALAREIEWRCKSPIHGWTRIISAGLSSEDSSGDPAPAPWDRSDGR